MKRDRPGTKVKIHRVSSREEVRQLEALGADYIGFHVDDDVVIGLEDKPFWQDNRCVMLDQLEELVCAVEHAQVFVESPPEQAYAARTVALKHNVPFIQVSRYDAADNVWLECQDATSFQVIAGNEYVGLTDGPALTFLAENLWPNHFATDLQVFPSDIDAWRTLSGLNGTLDEVVTRDRLRELAAIVPLFLAFNFTPANVVPICEHLSPWPIRGLSMTLSPSKIGSFHTYSFPELIAVLESYRYQGG